MKSNLFKKFISFGLSLAMAVTSVNISFAAGVSTDDEAAALSSIVLGDYVKMGNYLGEDILWRCVGYGAVVIEDIENIADGTGGSSTQTITYTKPFATEEEAKAASSEYYPLMLSDKILCIKPFDVSGTDTSGSHGRGYIDYDIKSYFRQGCGSNYWGDSNIRCWLNSTSSAGNVEWTCGNPPDSDHVDYNAYDQEAGFLNNFTAAERSAMKAVTQKQLLNGYEYSDDNTIDSNYHQSGYNIDSVLQNYDTAYSETTTDTMFLLDVKQLYNVYSNLGDYYMTTCTAAAVADSEYTDSDVSTTNNGYYWLCSPDADDYTSSTVRCVDPSGNVYRDNADSIDWVGVRPAFYLNLQSAVFKSGTGTESDPYTLAENETEITNNETEITNNDTLTVSEAMGEIAEGETAAAGTNNAFILSEGISTEAEAVTVEGLGSYDYVIKSNGVTTLSDGLPTNRAIKFTTAGPATLQVAAVSSSSDESGAYAVYAASTASIIETVDVSGSAVELTTISLPSADTYYIACSSAACDFYSINVVINPDNNIGTQAATTAAEGNIFADTSDVYMIASISDDDANTYDTVAISANGKESDPDTTVYKAALIDGTLITAEELGTDFIYVVKGKGATGAIETAKAFTRVLAKNE